MTALSAIAEGKELPDTQRFHIEDGRDVMFYSWPELEPLDIRLGRACHQPCVGCVSGKQRPCDTIETRLLESRTYWDWPTRNALRWGDASNLAPAVARGWGRSTPR